MLLELMGGREAHEEAVVPGYWVRQTLDRFLEFPVLALVLVERDILRKPQDRQDAGQQWLLAAFHHDVGPDRGRSPAGKIEDVRPDLVAIPRQPGPEPADKLIVVRRGVADKYDIAF